MDDSGDVVSVEFGERLGELCALVGAGGMQSADWTNEHSRWALYSESIRASSSHAALLNALQLEPDPSVVSAVVAEMLERIDVGEASAWLNLAPNDPFLARRSQEVLILREIIASKSPMASIAPIEDWSDWLQLRVATSASGEILAVLATRGRTKRIRATASDRLRTGAGR